MKHIFAYYLTRGALLWKSEEKLMYRLRDENAKKLLPEISEKKAEILEELSLGASQGMRYPLTENQRDLYLHQALYPDDSAYNVSLTLRFPAHTETSQLAQALSDVTARHPSLRRMYEQCDQEIYQYIPEKEPSVEIQYHQANDNVMLEQTLSNFQQIPFEINRSVLWRAGVFSIESGEEVILCFVIHHINVDFWSLGLIVTDIHAVLFDYPLEILSKDVFLDHVERSYLAKQHPEKESAAAINFARKYVPFALPKIGPRQSKCLAQSFYFSVNGTDKSVIENSAIRLGISPFILMMTVYFVLLSRITGHSNLAICIPTLGRSAEEMNSVGYFVNPRPIRTDLDELKTVQALAHSLRVDTFDAMEEGGMNYAQVLKALREEVSDLPDEPFPAFMNWNVLPSDPELHKLLEKTRFEQVGGFCSLMLTVTEVQGEYQAAWTYDNRCSAFIESWHTLFMDILSEISMKANSDLVQLPRLSTRDQQLLLHWNLTDIDYGEPETLSNVIERQCSSTPDHIALRFEGAQMTYAELNRNSNALAAHLQATGVKAGQFVGICMERSMELVVALIAIQRLGAAFVPLDPTYPPERLEKIIDDACLRHLVVHAYTKNLTGLPQSLLVDATKSENSTSDTSSPFRNSDPGSAAYMLYTSGSTGTPKGVIITHKAIHNRLFWMQAAYGLVFGDCVLQKTPYSFDVSVWEFFWPLMFGATLVIARPNGHKDPEYLKTLVRTENITHMHFVPSMLQVYLEFHEHPVHSTSLKHVFCSGEALPPKLVGQFFKIYTKARLHNLYGPTEATIDVSSFECQPEHAALATIPIGIPVANTRLHVLNEQFIPTPIGSEGELYIEGIQLSSGYHQRPDLNVTAFLSITLPHNNAKCRLYKTGDLVRWDPDGQLEYLGRRDSQIKLRGQRVELAEIEMAIGAHPQVATQAVLVNNNLFSPTLFAFVVLKAGAINQAELLQEIRDHLLSQLPLHMVPAQIAPISFLPVTNNGKLDRKALMKVLEPELVTSYQSINPYLLAAWNTVLDQTRDPSDQSTANFFVSGGDSIRALQLLEQLEAHGIVLKAHDLYQYPTLQGLNRLILRSQKTSPQDQILPFTLVPSDITPIILANLEDAMPLTTLQEVMYSHSLRNPHVAIYHDVFIVHLKRGFLPSQIRSTLQALTDRHQILRAAVRSSKDGSLFLTILQVVEANFDSQSLSTQDDYAEALENLIQSEKNMPFDFEHAPLLRTRFLSNGTRHALILSFHHLILDGWSVASLIQAIISSLLQETEFLPGHPQEVSFANYVALEKASSGDVGARIHWEELMRDAPATFIGSDIDSRTNVAGARIAQQRIPLSESQERLLREKATNLKVSLKSLCMAMHCRVLMLLLNRSDITTTYVSDGRPEINGYSNVLGLHLNTLPMRTAGMADNCNQFIRDIFAMEVTGMPYRRFPMMEIVRDIVGGRFSNTVFNFTDFHIYRANSNAMELVLDIDVHEFTDFDFVSNFMINPRSAKLELFLSFRADQISTIEIKWISAIYEQVIAGFVDEEGLEAKISNIDLPCYANQTTLLIEELCRNPLLESAQLGGLDSQGQRIILCKPTLQAMPQRDGFQLSEKVVLYRPSLDMEVLCINRTETDFNYKEVFEDSLFERVDFDLPPDSVIFDVGANIGLFTLYVQNRFPIAQIFSFEPITSIFDVLVENRRAYATHGKAINKALSNKTGQTCFSFYQNNTLISGMYTDEHDIDVSVQAVLNNHQLINSSAFTDRDNLKDYVSSRLNKSNTLVELSTVSEEIRLANLSRIDLLKIDVEKAEVDVLNGIEEEHWPLIQNIYAEIHDIDGRMQFVCDLLRNKGFKVLWEQDMLLQNTNIYSLIATRAAVELQGAQQRHVTRPWRFGAASVLGQISIGFAALPAQLREGHVLQLSIGENQHASPPPSSPQAQMISRQIECSLLPDEVQKLEVIWHELFQQNLPSLDQDLNSLGVDSISLLRLLRRINIEFDTSISVSQIDSSMSLNSLVSLRHKEIKPISISTLSSHSERPTILLVTPFATPENVYQPLIQALSPRVNLLQITLPDRAYESMDLMQVAYIHMPAASRALDRANFLVGWSLGGNLAICLSHLWARSGNAALPVIILDSFLVSNELTLAQDTLLLDFFAPKDALKEKRYALLKSLQLPNLLPKGLHIKATKTDVPDGLGVIPAASMFVSCDTIQLEAGHYDILSEDNALMLSNIIIDFLDKMHYVL